MRRGVEGPEVEGSWTRDFRPDGPRTDREGADGGGGRTRETEVVSGRVWEEVRRSAKTFPFGLSLGRGAVTRTTITETPEVVAIPVPDAPTPPDTGATNGLEGRRTDWSRAVLREGGKDGTGSGGSDCLRVRVMWRLLTQPTGDGVHVGDRGRWGRVGVNSDSSRPYLGSRSRDNRDTALLRPYFVPDTLSDSLHTEIPTRHSDARSPGPTFEPREEGHVCRSDLETERTRTPDGRCGRAGRGGTSALLRAAEHVFQDEDKPRRRRVRRGLLRVVAEVVEVLVP